MPTVLSAFATLAPIHINNISVFNGENNEKDPSPHSRFNVGLHDSCQAHLQGRTGSIPPVQVRARPRDMELYLLAISSPAGWLLCPPARQGLLAGLWSWPLTPAAEAQARVAGAGWTGQSDAVGAARAWPDWVQVYTHLRQTVHPLALHLEAAPAAPPGLAWVSAAVLATLPMGRRDQRLRTQLDQPALLFPWSGEAWAAARAVLAGA